MSYLSEGPEVANYRSGEIFTSLNQHYPLYNNNSNSSSFNRPIDDRRQVDVPVAPPLNRYGESQIQAVFAPVSAPPRSINSNSNGGQPQKTNSQYETNYQNGVNRDSNFTFQNRESNARFDTYSNLGPSSYKYNVFSVIDQPWNRCSKGQSCACSTGNQCIADQNSFTQPMPRQYL